PQGNIRAKIPAHVCPNRIVHVELFRTDPGKDGNRRQYELNEKRQPGIEPDRQVFFVAALGAKAKIESQHQDAGTNQGEDQAEHREAITDHLGKSRNPMDGLVSLNIRQIAHALLCCRIAVDVGLRNLIEADLAIDRGDEGNADENAQQKWKPPTGISADIDKGFRRRDKCVDNALHLTEGGRFPSLLHGCSHACHMNSSSPKNEAAILGHQSSWSRLKSADIFKENWGQLSIRLT